MTKTAPSARVVCDSVSPAGDRLTTMLVVCHRFVLAEFNTHRVFSRNSSSSRAIPFSKMLERVETDPAVPLSFPAKARTMRGGDELEPDARADAEQEWIWAASDAALAARTLDRLGVHKSVVNRLLEPFLWHTIVVSSTDWDNFFRLRCHPDAQPEIRAAAEAMRDALHASTPDPVDEGEWHMPFLVDDDRETLPVALQKRVCAARCARASYLAQDEIRPHTDDLELYERLTTSVPAHASPLEHVATPHDPSQPRLGNFVGWRQLRHGVEPS